MYKKQKYKLEEYAQIHVTLSSGCYDLIIHKLNDVTIISEEIASTRCNMHVRCPETEELVSTRPSAVNELMQSKSR